MQTVGEKLRKARLEKNLTLDEVYKQTKIHPRVLEALEQGEADNFLSLLYIKGFLKSYAQFLGLNGEKLLKEYVDSQKTETQPPKTNLERSPKTPSKIKSFLTFRIITVVVLLIGFIIYFRFVQKHIPQPVEEGKKRKVKVRVMPAPGVEEERLMLEVRTLDDCWLRVKIDDKSIFEGTLSKGKREHWQAEENIRLRIGKPEALEVFLNGKPIDLEKAKVKRTLVITREGIQGK